MKAKPHKQSSSESVQTEPDEAAAVSSEVLEQMQLIVELEKHAAPTSHIISTLGVSRSTFYRRKKEMKRILQEQKEGSKDAVAEEIAVTIAFFKEVRETGMKLATASKRERVSGLKIALKAQRQMVRFLFRIGFFEEYKTAQRIKADTMLTHYADERQKQTILNLLDENQMLRENVAAREQGKPKPHDLTNSPDWGTLIGEQSGNCCETFETYTENEDFKMLH